MIIEFYPRLKSGNDVWFWRLKAKNGKIVADGAEDYSNRGNVQRACKKVAALFKPGAVTIVEAEE
jgi:uncharacterized protein YegP (UPF0339 family)